MVACYDTPLSIWTLENINICLTLHQQSSSVCLTTLPQKSRIWMWSGQPNTLLKPDKSKPEVQGRFAKARCFFGTRKIVLLSTRRLSGCCSMYPWTSSDVTSPCNQHLESLTKPRLNIKSDVSFRLQFILLLLRGVFSVDVE